MPSFETHHIYINGKPGRPGRRIIESIPFGTQPVRTAVQTGNCLNKCLESVTYEQLIKLVGVMG